MSEPQREEEIQTGKAGVEKSQGWTEMPSASPTPVEPALDLETAVAERVERATEPEAEVVEYHRLNRDGSRSDVRSDERQSITAERAAKDLSTYRDQKAQVERQLREQALAEQLERLKSPLAEMTRAAETAKGQWERDAEALPEAERQAYIEQRQLAEEQARAQAAQQPQPQLPDPVLKALEDPVVLRAVMDQHQQDLAEGQRATVAAHQAISEASRIATAAIFARHPQMDQFLNLTPAQQAAEIQNNPALQADLNNVRNIIEADARQQVQQQTHYQRQFQHWAAQQDSAWDAEISKEPPQRQQAIRAEAHSMLNEFGMSDQEIAHQWNSNPLLRSAAGQRVLADAAKFRLQEKAAKSMRPSHKPSRVQIPGSPSDFIPQADVDQRALANKLTGAKGNEALRLAAQMLINRRARGG